ncbi:MAG: hypothetical protein ACR2LS_02235 [Thermomicrobiales bacterium]|jgi:uncharacterized protein (TIGR02588 family)
MTAHDQPSSDRHQGQQGRAEHGSRERSLAEWTTLIVSVLIVGTLIGAALVEYFWLDEARGVRLEATLALEQTRRVDDRYYIPFTVTNSGADGAENVNVVFEVQQDGQTVEESTIQIAFMANGGMSQGEMVTAYDPAVYDVSARVSAFETP